jgi:hypothetical protein
MTGAGEAAPYVQGESYYDRTVAGNRAMKTRALIATHHKTGTAWMIGTFRSICRTLDIPFLIGKSRAEFKKASAPVVIFHAQGFRNQRQLLKDPDARIFHLIRDPRDVIISGMRFHREAKEDWLHVPQEKFGGLSYQEKLNALPSDRDRYLLEMNHVQTIDNMMTWNYHMTNSFECKYEDLICDTDMKLFPEIARHLGFSESEMDFCRDDFWRQHIFGGMSQEKLIRKKHIRSGTARQWPKIFDREMGQEFLRCHGAALRKLGYEADNSWIDMLPDRHESA